MRSPFPLWTLLLLPLSADLAAECSCLCVDGTFKTLCGSPAELQAAGDRCHSIRHLSTCPPVPAGLEPGTYPPPVSGATNCRDVSVYDAAADDHLVARVCDVEPGG